MDRHCIQCISTQPDSYRHYIERSGQWIRLDPILLPLPTFFLLKYDFPTLQQSSKVLLCCTLQPQRMPNFHRPSPLLSLLPLLLPVLLFLLGAPMPASSAPLLLDEEHVAATIFTVLYDGDDDGALSVAADGADVASFAAHLGFTPRNVLKVWRRLDLDGDGAISVDELVAGPPASQPKAKALHERLTATIAQSWAKNLPIERVLAILGHTDGDMGDARAHVRSGVAEFLAPHLEEVRAMVKATNRER